MGYRDDETALEQQLDVLRREVAPLEERLARVLDEGQSLQRAVAKKKIRIAFFRVGKWIVGHPKIMFTLAVIVLIVGLVYLDRHQQEKWRLARLAATVGEGCEATLKINASFEGTRIRINGALVGEVPQEIKICPNPYVVQLIHDRALPWQRRISIHDQDVTIEENLIAADEHRRPEKGMLVNSAPISAFLYVDGKEVGRTPYFLKRDTGSGKSVTLALAHDRFVPNVWTIGWSREIWLSLIPDGHRAKKATRDRKKKR